MSDSAPSFYVRVDVTNPGQVIACCGLLELAHRLWPGAEGWFDGARFNIRLPCSADHEGLNCLVKALSTCEITGLSEAERKEQEELKNRSRELRKRGEKIGAREKTRLKELDKQARTGTIRIGSPFNLLLDWWRASDETITPKTWAGRQEVHKIARAAQDALATVSDLTTLFEHGSVLYVPEEYRSEKDREKKVEPFYFDARRFAHALDAGFSLDVQQMEAIAYPAVELLCLIGLQRFRPVIRASDWSFEYWVWAVPLEAPTAAAVFSGTVSLPQRQQYRFRLRFRDDKKRYRAFGFATAVGGES
jgi:CRISPR-associated protein Csb3